MRQPLVHSNKTNDTRVTRGQNVVILLGTLKHCHSIHSTDMDKLCHMNAFILYSRYRR